MTTETEKKWYVVQAYSGYEKKVKAALLKRIGEHKLDDKFGDILIPTEQVQETRNGKRRVREKTFYPGYMFVHMVLNEFTWHVVKDTPKVSGFVGGRHPAPVPDRQIRTVTAQVEEGAAMPKPTVIFEAGDHVRVIDGAFSNFTGTVEEVDNDRQKLKVLVSIFGRATPVTLEYAQVEKNA